jgi:hypothetical protein
MSAQLLENGDDYPDAATKHLDDARALLRAGRFDGAAYLAGYVIECSLKALVVFEDSRGRPPWEARRARKFKHHIRDLGAEALRLASALGSFSARYQPNLRKDHPVHSAWKETLRYRGTGAVTPEVAAEWLDEAELVWRSVVGEMKLDGVV